MQLYLKAYQVYERVESARKRDATPIDPDDFYDDDDDIWFRGYGPGRFSDMALAQVKTMSQR